MMTVLGCIKDHHDLVLVIVAALVCVAGSWATIRLFARASATTATERTAWLVLTAVVSGASIWCTHFIAMLGYDPGVPIAFDPVLTITSLLVAMLGAVLGFAFASSRVVRYAPVLGGCIVGLAIVLMHYTGMMAYRVQGIVSWDMSYLVASIVLSITFSALALHVAVRGGGETSRCIAAGALVLAIVSLHFTGMTAFRVEPMLIDGTFSNPAALRALALAVAGVAAIVIGAGIASRLIDNRARAEASEALGNMSNGLLMIDANGTIRLYNNRTLELFALRPDELGIGMSLGQYLRNVGAHVGWDEIQTQRIIDNHRKWMAQDTTTTVEHHFQGGMILTISCRPMKEGGAVLTYDDVTEAREGQKQIEHMAFHDALTSLPNRRSFVDHVERLAKRGPYAMLMIDLDRFKDVNDTLGHAVGDKLLVAVAFRLRDKCSSTNLLFRLGGDELAVLGEMEVDDARALATEIVRTLARPFQIDEHTISIGGSIGLAMSQHGDDSELVQRKADLALYEAKRGGRGRAEVYREGMIEEAEHRRRLEIDLAGAVQAGQMELHYQPLYELPSRGLSGFEALLRWDHPERGWVSPSEFIPLAEQTGAIVDIGAWVIDEACRQASLWPSHIYVSINVSPVQLRSTDILRLLTLALDQYGLTPRRIEIEITETAMVEDSEQIAAALAGLRALGVRIAMDDFGTGYSSLAHLREFELDRIKIDRSFIAASRTDKGSAAVVRAVTSMARDLAISTTGEGVESEEQLENLIALGCETAQGFLLGKPLDVVSATALVESQASDMKRLVSSAPQLFIAG